MKRLIIVGSPRVNGRSAHLAEMLFEANIDEHPEDELFLVPVSEVEIGPCIGCNACRKKSGVILKNDDGSEVTVQRHRCIFDDDMQTLYDLIDDVDEVTVVSPVYFSGAPAPMKCVLDRLQPYFWARLEARKAAADGIAPLPEKRPLSLHVLGEGGDPHGYDALVSEVRSAFAIADFRLERILDWVGKIDSNGEVIAEAVEISFDASGKRQRPKLNLHADEEQPNEERTPKTNIITTGSNNRNSNGNRKATAKAKTPSGNRTGKSINKSGSPSAGKQAGNRTGKRTSQSVGKGKRNGRR
jgi:NAD(P)H-dependent FMN reductase